MEEIYEIVSVRQANADSIKYDGKIFYIYKEKVWAYSKLSKLPYRHRWRVICNSNYWEEKLKTDLENGWKARIINDYIV